MEQYLEVYPYLQIDPNSVRWTRLTPWQATYWKELPVGHQARYRGKEIDGDGISPHKYEIWSEKLRMWQKWYINPFLPP